jgi:VIT1/CCC1 family predicted Fe2+/Mn2+ transporter
MHHGDLEHSHDPGHIAERLAQAPSPSYLRDYIYGGIDGAITTFAIVSGVVGANMSDRAVLILGVANVLADGFSMAAANFSSTRTEIDEYEYMRRMEERHIDAHPEGEREEVRQIFRAKGFRGRDLDGAVRIITAERERWVTTMMTEEHGLPPVSRSPWRSAGTTFLAFLLCGLVPITPFAVGMGNAVEISAVMTAMVFFAIGSFRSRWSAKAWWHAGAETTAIGLAAAGVAYITGDLLEKMI